MHSNERVAVIVAVYKDTEALKLILDSLLDQTYPPDEIIITEDGEYAPIAQCLSAYNDKRILHLTQEDSGWRKNRALNRAIAASTCDYLIFIDGDCVPHTSFVEYHFTLRQQQHALCGRRSEPGAQFSTKLRNQEMTIKEFFANYVANFFKLKKDEVRHYEEGLFFPPTSFIFGLIHTLSRKESHMVGCNWSGYKHDLLKINGFDEDFTLPTTGEDTDVERRLRHFGIHMKSCRNAAIMVHLYHKKNFNQEISQQTEALMETKKDTFICKNGLTNHLDNQTSLSSKP